MYINYNKDKKESHFCIIKDESVKLNRDEKKVLPLFF